MEAGTALVPMTLQEHEQLTMLESTIERGLGTFSDVGAALALIRDGRLYRESHRTFEDYCRDRWAISRPRAYQLIDAAEIVRNVSTIVDIVPSTESQARPLAGLEPEIQRQVWERSVETAPDGKVTAKHVEQTVQEWKYDQGIQYGEQASAHTSPNPEPLANDDDSVKTVTLRVARVVYLLTLGRHMDLREIAEKTGLTENGAWRMMNRLENGHYVPVTVDDEGKWCILGTDADDMPV